MLEARPAEELRGSAARAALDAIVAGADYRCEFSNRSAWHGTAHRSDDGQVALIWRGATTGQDRVFPLAIEDDLIVAISKPSWGNLVKLTPRRAGRGVTARRPARPKMYTPHPDRARRLASKRRHARKRR